jgi:hypothetical protein
VDSRANGDSQKSGLGSLSISAVAAQGLNKDGDYTYHHCAVLQIRATPNKAIGTRSPAEKK